MSKTIKKDFFAPLASGLGAMRRAAVLLLVMMLTTMTAWAQNPFDEYEGTGNLTISTPGRYSAEGLIDGDLIIDTEGEVILDVSNLLVQDILINPMNMNGKLTLNVHSYSVITAISMQVTTLNMDGGTINCDNIDIQSGTISGGTINAEFIYASGNITGGTLAAKNKFYAGGLNNLTISGGNISAPTINIYAETTINVTDPNFSIEADTYENTGSKVLTISGRSLIDNGGNVYAAGEAVDLSAIVKTLKPAYTVTFDENGGSDVTDLTVAGGSTISAPVTTRDGYSLEGWYNGTNAYDFSANVTDDLALKAHWKEKKQLSNLDITVSAIADQTYTGSAIEPTVTVKDGETDITTECDIVITNNTNVGTANVAITAKSESVDYSGSTSTTFTIVPKAVTITADNDSKTYDGTPLVKNTFTTSALESGDTHTFTVVMSSGSTITNVGIQPNVIAKVDGVDVNTGEIIAVGNYLVTTVDGALTINPITENVTVTITENSDNPVYDGSEHTVEGYAVTDISNTLYTKDDFTFSGTATASGTDAGTYEMELTSGDFTNNNQNFSNVTFNVINGALTINPLEGVIVTITEHSNSDEIVYNGQEHTVTGYDVAIDNELYTEADFTFSGNAEVKGTNAGTYEMELKPGDFTNINQNFSNVTFNVIDGKLTVNPVIVKVSVVDKGNGEPIVDLHVFVSIKSNTETNGNIIHEWYSTTENHIIEGIKAGGEYTIMGNAFKGYTNSAEYTLTIDENGNVSSYSGTTTEDGVLLVESGQTHVEFSVVDKANSTALAGATIQVIDSDNKVVEEWVSVSETENHIIEGLTIFEEYTLCETVAPNGYAAPVACTFTIDETGKVTTTGGTTTTDEEGNTVLVLKIPFTVPLFAANSSNLWMTWCDEYDYVKPEGVTVYKVSGVENNTVTLEKVSVIPAYTPVLLYREEAGEDAVTATFSAVGTAPASDYDSSSGIVEANLSDNVTLYGNSGDEAYASGNSNNIYAISDLSDTQSYVLRNGNFVAVDKDGGIGAHRCWLNVTKSTTNGARLLSINTGGENTGIETTNFTTPTNSSGAWYGLDGRKLDKQPTKKGLYIYNGKKHVIK